MALIAHWPLNGNTNDISGSGLNGIPTNITYTNGKIGQAASFNGTDSMVEVSNFPLVFNGSVSLSGWAYYLDDSRGIVFGNYNSFNDINFEKGANRQLRIYWNRGERDVYSSVNAFPLNEWFHFVLVRNVNLDRFEFWVNGILVNAVSSVGSDVISTSQTFRIGRDSRTGTTTTNGLLNDIRLYDHALSDMEIQELARAKILHYTFNDMQEPTTNVFIQYTENGQNPLAGDGSSTNLGIDTNNKFRGLNSVKFQTGSAGNFYINGASKIRTDLNSSDWTSTMYIKRVDGATISSVGTYMYINGNSNANTVESVTLVENGWYKVTRTRSNLVSGYPTLVGCYNLEASAQYYVAMWQIEPKKYDTEYAFISRAGRVNDYSGFFNHSIALTAANTPRWTSEAKIGTGAYEFNNSRIETPAITYISQDQLTLSAWVKPIGTHTNDRGIVIQQNGNYYLTVTPTQQVSVYWYDTSPAGYHTTTETLSLNQWSHIASVWTGTQNIIYINGTAVKTTNVTTPGRAVGGSPVTIGIETTNRAFMGYIDDVRQYATALSSSDIFDLYETRAEIEENGSFYAKEFISNVESTENIMTAGFTDLSNNNNQSVGGESFVTKKVLSNNIYGVEMIQGSTTNIVYLTIHTNANAIPAPAQYVTFSADVKSNKSGVLKSQITIFVDGVKYWLQNNGTWLTSVAEYTSLFNGITTLNEWMRATHTFQLPTSGVLSNFNMGTFYRTQGAWTMEITNLQVEYKPYATPFTSTYRPISLLPSIVQFDKDEINENGISNFEDFSTVGITNGMNTYMPLRESLIRELSGWGYSIAVTSDPIFRGDHYRMDGIDDQINTGNNAISDWNTPFSLMICIRVPTEYDRQTTAQTAIIGRGSYAGSVGLAISSTSNFNFFLRTNSGSTSANLGTFDRDVWYHLVGTWDGVNTMRSYRDGLLITESTVTDDKQGVPGGSSWLVTPSMAFSGSSGGRLLADINDLKIFNRSLSAEEVRIEYNTMVKNEVQVSESGTLYGKDLKQY
jgi:hypothetical protein